MRAQILFPIDGSEASERSLACATSLTALPNIEICLVRIPSDSAESGESDSIQEYLINHAVSLESEVGLPVSTRVPHGPPFLAILGEAEMENVAMIVMTTQGSGAVGKHGIGSVTDRIVRYAACPTLIVCPSCNVGPVEEIVVPLDGSRLAEEAIPVASLLAQMLQIPVNLMRVFESPEDEGDSKAYLSNVHATQIPSSVYVHEVASQGPVTQTLLRELQEHPRSLLVMSAHGGEGFRSYAVGRVSDEILAETPVPVLLVHSGHSRRFTRLLNS